MTLGNIVLIIVLITLNAFFVGVEFSVVSSRRSRLDLLPEANSKAGAIMRDWLEQPASRDRLIAASQLGITLVSLALGAVGENAFAAWLEPYFLYLEEHTSLPYLGHILSALPLIISLTVVTGVHVVLGEQVPKVAVLRKPEEFGLQAAPFMRTFMVIFKYFINLLDWATHIILKLAGLPVNATHMTMVTSEEIKQMVNGPESEGIIEQPEREMISAVIDFGDLVVRQVAIPRVEIIAVPADATINEAFHTASENNMTKLPVYEDDIEHIVGVIHILDLLQAIERGQDPNKAQVRSLAREALFVPENISVSNLLHQFKNRRTHIAIVLDEFGGTAGLVTLDDLLEEITGVINDPFDALPPAIQPMPDGSVLIDGKTLIEEVNDHFRLNLSDENYDTIAGYVLGKLGRIPMVGDSVEDKENNILLKVDAMERLRIAYVRMTGL